MKKLITFAFTVCLTSIAGCGYAHYATQRPDVSGAWELSIDKEYPTARVFTDRGEFGYLFLSEKDNSMEGVLLTYAGRKDNDTATVILKEGDPNFKSRYLSSSVSWEDMPSNSKAGIFYNSGFGWENKVSDLEARLNCVGYPERDWCWWKYEFISFQGALVGGMCTYPEPCNKTDLLASFEKAPTVKYETREKNDKKIDYYTQSYIHVRMTRILPGRLDLVVLKNTMRERLPSKHAEVKALLEKMSRERN